MIRPCGQARLSVCQPQPASTRSSRASDGARAAAAVARAGAAAAGVGGARQRAQARVLGGAAVVEAGGREVDDPPAGRA